MEYDKLQIPLSIREEVIAHCQRHYPKEACGLLAADATGAIVQMYPMKNIENTAIGYAMDPKQQLLVEKQMRQQGQQLVGIFHSHTASAAEPSSVDIELAISPDVAYVLVSLKDQSNPDFKSYRINGAEVTPMRVLVANPDGTVRYQPE